MNKGNAMKPNSILVVAVAAMTALVLAGCAGSQSGHAYSRSQTRG